jgi:hypothetical protein
MLIGSIPATSTTANGAASNAGYDAKEPESAQGEGVLNRFILVGAFAY